MTTIEYCSRRPIQSLSFCMDKFLVFWDIATELSNYELLSSPYNLQHAKALYFIYFMNIYLIIQQIWYTSNLMLFRVQVI